MSFEARRTPRGGAVPRIWKELLTGGCFFYIPAEMGAVQEPDTAHVGMNIRHVFIVITANGTAV